MMMPFAQHLLGPLGGQQQPGFGSQPPQHLGGLMMPPPTSQGMVGGPPPMWGGMFGGMQHPQPIFGQQNFGGIQAPNQPAMFNGIDLNRLVNPQAELAQRMLSHFGYRGGQ